MADEETTSEEQQPEENPPMPKKKRMIMFGGIFVGQLVLVLILGQLLIKPQFASREESAPVEEGQRGAILMLDDITVNLQSAKRTRFLRLKIGLELEDPAVQAEVEQRTPEIRDIVIGSISGLDVGQLITVEGKERLKRDLKKRINGTLQEGSLINVYFSDFVVQ